MNKTIAMVVAPKRGCTTKAKPKKMQKGGRPEDIADEDVDMCSYHKDDFSTYFLLKTFTGHIYKFTVDKGELVIDPTAVEKPDLLSRLPQDVLDMVCSKLEPIDRSNASIVCKELNAVIDNNNTLAIRIQEFIKNMTDKFATIEIEKVLAAAKEHEQKNIYEHYSVWSSYFSELRSIYVDQQWRTGCKWVNIDRSNYVDYEDTDGDMEAWAADHPREYRAYRNTSWFKRKFRGLMVKTVFNDYIETVCWMPHEVLIKETLDLHTALEKQVHIVFDRTQEAKNDSTLKTKLEICKAAIYQRMCKLPSFWIGMFIGDVNSAFDKAAGKYARDLLKLDDPKINGKLQDVLRTVKPVAENKYWCTINYGEKEMVFSPQMLYDEIKTLAQRAPVYSAHGGRGRRGNKSR
jgi:hypothetical protein